MASEICHCPCCAQGIAAPHEYHLERRPMPPAPPHPDHWICGHANCAPCEARGVGFQGGLSNDDLRAAFKAKLPGIEPTDRDLTVFALGVEVGSAVPHGVPGQAKGAPEQIRAALDKLLDELVVDAMAFGSEQGGEVHRKDLDDSKAAVRAFVLDALGVERVVAYRRKGAVGVTLDGGTKG